MKSRGLGDVYKRQTFNSIYRIENSSDYLWAGIRTPIMLTDANLTVNYSMKKDNFPLESIAPRIFTFNKSRYLITCSAGLGGASKATPTLSVYDISKGSTVKEALEIFDKGENHNPVYSFILGGSGTVSYTHLQPTRLHKVSRMPSSA